LLVNAPAVYVGGGMSSRAFADYMGYISTMAFAHWEVLDTGREPLGAMVQRLNPAGVLIVISMQPFSKQVVTLSDRAAEAGLQLIVITDCDLGPTSKHTDYVFNTATESPQFFSSYAATVVLLESLIAMVVRRGGDEVQARIEQVEALNHEAGEYCWDSSL